MKIQVDTKAKTIKVEEEVGLDEFITALNKLFPENGWKEYRLITGTVIEWREPIVIDKWWPVPPAIPYPEPPYIVTCETRNNSGDIVISKIPITGQTLNYQLN